MITVTHTAEQEEWAGPPADLLAGPIRVYAGCTVYRLYDADGRLLYVGKAIKPRSRLRLHERRSPWWPAVRLVVIHGYPTEWDAEHVEREAILTESPAHNVAGTPALLGRTSTGRFAVGGSGVRHGS